MTESKQESPRVSGLTGTVRNTLKSRYTGEVSHTRREAWEEALNEVSLMLSAPQESFQGGSEQALREAGEYLYRYFVMPGHSKLAKDCPNNNCPFCKWEAALSSSTATPAPPRIQVTLPGGTSFDLGPGKPVLPASVESFQGMLAKWRESTEHHREYDEGRSDCADEAQLLFTRLVELRDSWLEAAAMLSMLPANQIAAHEAKRILTKCAAQLTELIEGKV